MQTVDILRHLRFKRIDRGKDVALTCFPDSKLLVGNAIRQDKVVQNQDSSSRAAPESCLWPNWSVDLRRQRGLSLTVVVDATLCLSPISTYVDIVCVEDILDVQIVQLCHALSRGTPLM